MISLVATVKAPMADLDRFTAYHLNTGVDHLYLFFDDPADPSLPAFTGRARITAVPCTPDRWRAVGIHPEQGIEARQQYNASVAMDWARAAGADWLLHVDSDELIHTPGDDLAAWLGGRAADVDAVVFPVLEAIPRAPDRAHPFDACRRFKAPARPDPALLQRAARLGCRSALRYGYFRGHLLGKAAVRTTAPIATVGIHFPTPSSEPLRLEGASDACVLHYDCCTFEAWRLKWARRKDGTGLLLTMRPDRRRQFEDFLAADAAGDPAALQREFRRQCLIPYHEQWILQALGLARTVYVRPDLFTPAE